MTGNPYGRRWRDLREAILADNPLCYLCLETSNQPVEATVVDHVVRHCGDPELFWDTTNLIPLCKSCHDSTAQTLEKSGRFKVPTGADGYPIELSQSVRDYINKKRSKK